LLQFCCVVLLLLERTLVIIMSIPAAILASLVSEAASLRFSTTHGDGMVLNSEHGLATVWGFCDTADAPVRVCVDDSQCVDAPVFPDGTFQASLPKFPASFECHRITATGSKGDVAVLKDVLFGLVWVCSGQSNMDMAVPMVFNSSAEVLDADNYPYIRLLTIAKDKQKEAMIEAGNITQSWLPASKISVGGEHWHPWNRSDFGNWEEKIASVPGGEGFSAACYFFGRELFREVQKPVGLIWSSFGGTNVETWTPTYARETCGDGKGSSANFNAMISPLLRNVITGAIWYQGESNSHNFQHYACTFPAMIQSWRESWHNATGGVALKSWPFGFVQLSTHDGSIGSYGENLTAPGYAGVRWAQTAGYGTAPNPAMPDTFMATAVDIGQASSPAAGPHVQDKQDVGRRLVLAFKKSYLGGDDIFAPGPLANKAVLHSGSVSVSFDNLSPMGFQSLPTQMGFEVSNGNDSWLNVSDVALSGNSRDVMLALPAGMTQPVFVRYLWATNACLPTPGLECPLHDADMNALPALPFLMNVTLPSPALWAV